MPWKDATIVVGDDGTGESDELPAVFLHNFSVKCDEQAVWKYEVYDHDLFIIFSSDSQGMDQLQGLASVPVQRKCNNIIFKLLGATPGTYNLRAYVD